LDILEASFYLSIVSLRITLRDVNHDNGVYYANNNNKEITINGSNYIFKNGKSIEYVAWDFLLNLMPELKNMLVVDIVELTKNINRHIIDSSI
jgi:hypothetical protein